MDTTLNSFVPAASIAGLADVMVVSNAVRLIRLACERYWAAPKQEGGDKGSVTEAMLDGLRVSSKSAAAIY